MHLFLFNRESQQERKAKTCERFHSHSNTGVKETLSRDDVITVVVRLLQRDLSTSHTLQHGHHTE